MTAFADYLDLRTNVIEVVGRSDITDVFDRLTVLAESYLNKELRMSRMIAEATVTFASGVGPLPADFREAIGLYDALGNEFIQQPVQKLKQQGWRRFFAISGTDILISTGEDGDRTLSYYQALTTLTGAPTNSNWLLQQYPEVYLYAVAYEAAKHIKDTGLIQGTGTARANALAEANDDDSGRRYSRARVRVAGCAP